MNQKTVRYMLVLAALGAVCVPLIGQIQKTAAERKDGTPQQVADATESLDHHLGT